MSARVGTRRVKGSAARAEGVTASLERREGSFVLRSSIEREERRPMAYS